VQVAKPGIVGLPLPIKIAISVNLGPKSYGQFMESYLRVPEVINDVAWEKLRKD
jgi:hypothetical protein